LRPVVQLIDIAPSPLGPFGSTAPQTRGRVASARLLVGGGRLQRGLILVGAVLVGACTNTASTSAPPATSSSTTSSSTTPLAATTTSGALLGPGEHPLRMRAVAAVDLGRGWHRADRSATFTSVDAQLRDQCPSIAEVRDAMAGRARVRYEFRHAAAALPLVTQDLTVFGTRQDAVVVFNAYAGPVIERCLPDLVTAAGLPTSDIVVERRPAMSAADATAAIRMTGASFVAGVASEVAVEVIVAQHGRSLSVVVATGSDLFPLSGAVRTRLLDALVQ